MDEITVIYTDSGRIYVRKLWKMKRGIKICLVNKKYKMNYNWKIYKVKLINDN